MTLDNALKYLLIIVTYKLWWPILKAMWNELQGAMWREGGLIGRTPTARDLVRLEEKYGHIESPLTSETFAEVKRREEREAREEKQGRGRSDVVQPAARRKDATPKSGSKQQILGPKDYGRPRPSAPASSARKSARSRPGF